MTTPIRRQYLRIKQQHPDAILLFRLGDFYETFDEDAKVVARELEIVLTSREMGRGHRVPLAGIPYHALEGHMARLIKRGYKVAICEQMTDPATSRGLVEREVVRVVTPGTVVEPFLLQERANNYLAAAIWEEEEAGLAHVDITTSSTVHVTQLRREAMALELERLAPAEVVVPLGQEGMLPPGQQAAGMGNEGFRLDSCRRLLLEHLGAVTLESYGCEHLPLAVRAAGALLTYLGDHQREALARLNALTTYDLSGAMVLDAQTRRNLELFQTARSGEEGPSLLSVLDFTKTAMGARLLRRWLGQPLLDMEEIGRRQQAVGCFHRDRERRGRVVLALGRIADVERLANRVRGGAASPREAVALRRSLEALPELAALLAVEGDSGPLRRLAEQLPLCQEATSLLAQALQEEPGQPGEGTVIKPGFSPELDELKLAAQDAREYIARLEGRERERTGIKNLKVGYNKVFGYYIEVTNPHIARVLPEYQRRQTLTTGERFITPELKGYENLVLNARERLQELEASLYRQVCRQVGEAAPQMLAAAESVAQVDVFAALAEAADRYDYVCPQVNDSLRLEIRDGRHPVVERVLPPGSFVPNDTLLSPEKGSLVIITGPNMSGKSTYIRQVALLVLMAQAGSFVPARSATIGLVDRIFTRIGLQDDLARGRSTFMVEMVETANILNSATHRSLIILDEIGRGTSTYDGLSIAQAVAEHIHNHPRLGCRTLFATHYHELIDLARVLPGACNYTVAVAEEGGKVVFLHRVVPGGADRSYGVHVAQLAGLPRDVVHRAWEVLRELEGNRPADGRTPRRRREKGKQLELLLVNPEVVEDLLRLDVNAMTPLEAINALYALQQKARDEQNG
ncbi:MAG: DNA mismatch repair protein MutS [Chloroflexi bacterium]|nr:DNA mismatch repair protein MutS [Chloroflexota bacterium]